MKPEQVASRLRQIASAIDNSKKPKAALVAADIKKVIASLGAEDPELDGLLQQVCHHVCKKAGVTDPSAIDEIWVQMGNALRDTIAEFDFSEFK